MPHFILKSPGHFSIADLAMGGGGSVLKTPHKITVSLAKKMFFIALYAQLGQGLGEGREQRRLNQAEKLVFVA